MKKRWDEKREDGSFNLVCSVSVRVEEIERSRERLFLSSKFSVAFSYYSS